MGAGSCLLMCPCEHVCIFGNVCVQVTLAVPRDQSPHRQAEAPLTSLVHPQRVCAEDWEGQRRLWTPTVPPGESFGCGRARGAPR